MSIRPVKEIYLSKPTLEGAGVRLRRAFGFGKTEDFDPFLLFDDFRGDQPSDYQAGFPWHPHRGIETITYVLSGNVEHRDSLGNHGNLKSGDIQWMTAGSGIIHQEMPEGDSQGRMHGFQLWANLPTQKKMTDPRYQDIPSKEIPEIQEDDGTFARVICGEFWGKRGPVEGIAADPRYLDITVPPHKTRTFKVKVDHHAFAYVFEGFGRFHAASAPLLAPTEYTNQEGTYMAHPAENRTLVLFDQGDEIKITAGDKGIRFLFVSGAPLREPVAWHGPIVMNTQEELIQAFKEYQEGTFLRHK